MAMEFKRKLPIPMEIREEMPLSAELTAKKQAFDAEVAKVFTGEDARKVLIIGPCSADREDSVLEYMNRLAKTAEEVKDKLIIIPRVYTNKPRTKGTGYKGLAAQPQPRGSRRPARGRQGHPPHAPARHRGDRLLYRR